MSAEEDAVRTLLRSIGDDPERDGLRDTPARFVKALMELTKGLTERPEQHLDTTFTDDYDELVVVRAVPFTSLCEHHLLPFTGTATIGYLPAGGKVVGLSKLARTLHGYARRPQIQERLTRQVVTAMIDRLAPQGAGVVLRASHTCMSLRGACTSGEMVTSALEGKFRTDASLRAEFLALDRAR